MIFEAKRNSRRALAHAFGGLQGSASILVALCLTLPGSARAQDPSPPSEAGQSAEGESGTRQSAAGPTPEGHSAESQSEAGHAGGSGDPGEVEEARERFQRGLALARAGNCGGALAELEASFRLAPRPNTMFNIAQCHEELHRYDLALASYQRYLDIASEDAEDRLTVERTMRTLTGLLGTIHVQSNVPSQVWLDDRVVGVAPGDVVVPGGTHVLELRAEGYVPERREVSVAARAQVEIDVLLAEARTEVTVQHHTTVEQHTTVERHESPPIPLPVFITGVVLSAGALAAGAGFGISAMIERQRQLSLHPALPRDPKAIEDAALLADVFLITGLVLTAGTVAIGFLTDFGGSDSDSADDSDPESVSVSWLPVVTPFGGALMVKCRFGGAL